MLERIVYKKRVCVRTAATSHKINTAERTTNNRNNKDRLI